MEQRPTNGLAETAKGKLCRQFPKRRLSRSTSSCGAGAVRSAAVPRFGGGWLQPQLRIISKDFSSRGCKGPLPCPGQVNLDLCMAMASAWTKVHRSVWPALRKASFSDCFNTTKHLVDLVALLRALRDCSKLEEAANSARSLSTTSNGCLPLRSTCPFLAGQL